MTRAAYLELIGKHARKNEEDTTQIALVEHLKWRAQPGVVWYMIKNHGKRSVAQLRKDAAMGLRKGASDMGFILPPHGTAAMLELKVWPNKPTPEQDVFAAEVVAAGGFHAVAYSLDEALSVLIGWGAIKPEL